MLLSTVHNRGVGRELRLVLDSFGCALRPGHGRHIKIQPNSLLAREVTRSLAMGEDWRIEPEYMQQGLRALGGNPDDDTGSMSWFKAPTEASLAAADLSALEAWRICEYWRGIRDYGSAWPENVGSPSGPDIPGRREQRENRERRRERARQRSRRWGLSST